MLALARHNHTDTNETVREYCNYIRNPRNLNPKRVEIWAIDEETGEGKFILYNTKVL